LKPKHIIFFDGSCGLCHRSVQFILSNDRNEIFHFSPLNSEFSKKELISTDSSVDTFYIKSDGVLYQKSEAWVKTLYLLGGVWLLIATVMSKLPKALLDSCYDFIAKHRSKIWGRKENCDLLSKDQKGRFI